MQKNTKNLGHSNVITVNVCYKFCVDTEKYEGLVFKIVDDKCFYIVLNVTLPNSMHAKIEYSKTK